MKGKNSLTSQKAITWRHLLRLTTTHFLAGDRNLGANVRRYLT